MSPRNFLNADRGLILSVLMIIVLGLYNLSSASQPMGIELHYRHGMFVLVGLVGMLTVASVHYRNLEGLAYPVFIVVVLLLAATLVGGRVVNGSRRWLTIASVNIQTSDLAKLAVIIIVAKTFHLERWEGGGLTLQGIFRPFNLSRPGVLVLAILAISIFGDGVRPAKLERWASKRWRPAAILKAERPVALIGRSPPKQEGVKSVRLRFGGVAKVHARVERKSDGVYLLTDLSEEEGTFVNGERIDGSIELNHGDVIHFGPKEQAKLKMSATILGARQILPWIALFSFLWLGLSFYLQYKRGKWGFRDILAPIDVVLIPCGLILIQPDLGTTLVVLLIAFSMILYVGFRPSSLIILIVGSVAFGLVSWEFILHDYQKQRVMNFLNPTSDLSGAGYHQNQSLIAIGSGQWWGKGFKQGTQTQLSFLPEQQTDFIFSVWAEEHGYMGCILLVGLFMVLILLALRVAVQARDRFGALLAVGVTAMLFWHTIVNMLMVLRMAPVVGVPLPLWSNGGSFAVTTLLGMGLLMNVSMRRRLF